MPVVLYYRDKHYMRYHTIRMYKIKEETAIVLRRHKDDN